MTRRPPFQRCDSFPSFSDSSWEEKGTMHMNANVNIHFIYNNIYKLHMCREGGGQCKQHGSSVSAFFDPFRLSRVQNYKFFFEWFLIFEAKCFSNVSARMISHIPKTAFSIILINLIRHPLTQMFTAKFCVDTKRKNALMLRITNNRKKAELYLGFQMTKDSLEDQLSANPKSQNIRLCFLFRYLLIPIAVHPIIR